MAKSAPVPLRIDAGFVDWDAVPEETIVEGVRRKLITTDKMTVVRWSWDAGMDLPAHRHPQDQFFYLISGRGVFESEGVRREMLPGDGWMIPGGAEHRTYYPVASVTIDIFAPPREDMIANVDPYIRAAIKKG